MPTITLPQATKEMKTGTVRRWRKRAGEAVAKGDVLVEIETDDGLVEVASGSAGQLGEILAEEGRTIPVAAPLAVLNPSGAAASQPAKNDTKAASVGASMSQKPAAAPVGKVIPVVMPKAGQSMEEGVLVKWHVKPGDTIKKGQIIFEIETDKATMEVEATDEGRLSRIVLDEGGSCPVLQDAFIASSGGGAAASTSPTAEPTTPAQGEAPRNDTPAPSPAQTTDTGRVRASPAARRAAQERGIDLSTLGAGSGPQGRILSTDVPAKGEAVRPTAAAAAQPAAPIEGVQRKKMSSMRKAIARNLVASKQNVPHFYLKLTINADPLEAFYRGEKAKYPCSLNDVVVLATARACMDFPGFRSRVDGDEIVTFPTANIGIAVGLEEGLVVPVVMGVEQMTLKQLGVETKRIAAAARSGKIENMGNGVFTITNLGMFGVEEFIGIINPPEAGILAVGTMKEEVIVSGGTLRPGRTMTLTLSADHRIVDGMIAAKFMARLKEILEYPQQLV
jgi:pyruvate dehydrogenase E2 component (dihydrolipoamide acetyltransferase)